MAEYVYDEYKFDVPWPCIRRHFSKDVVWIYGGERKNKDLPLVGKCEGHDQMAKWLEQMNTLLKVNKWKPKDIIVERDPPTNDEASPSQQRKVIVIMDVNYTVNETGKTFDNEEVHIHYVNTNFVSTKVHMLFDFTPCLEAFHPTQ
eukprot:TRINITY_DN13076_c0_g1_i1.p1 TRINITY_DN13076_c0_g1~~TRINITY_DN13076_c0_g1_i1.p1  ORF type:complete len:156 (+),score=24.86 TRINITY_DN13076_c0_g1_i1:33-470(+)